MAIDVGKITRWKTRDGIMWAENNWIKMAYAVFNPEVNEAPFGIGIRNGIFVELITAEQAKAFDDAPIRN